MTIRGMVRKLDRAGYCRCCDKNIGPKSEPVFYMNSWRIRQSIILCEQCVRMIGSTFDLYEQGDV